MRALLTLFAVCAFAFTAHAARELAKPQLIAVYAYADWCPNCKALTPIAAEARKVGGFDQKPILFVTLDLTDSNRIQQSILHASALGIGAFLQAQGSATGYIAVLDARTKKEVARFDRTNTSKDITETLNALLAGK